MKTILVVMCMTFFNPDSVLNEAPSNNKIAIVQNETAIISLKYLKQNNASVKISILNERGQLVFTEKIRESFFVRPYNFKELPSGWYNVQIMDGTETITERVYIGLPAAPLAKPVVNVRKVDNSSMALTISTQHQSDITVEIYDRNNRLLQSIMEEDVLVMGRLLVMKEVDAGYLLIINNGQVVRHNFNLRQ